jgi:Fe-S oxidoreductase
MKHTTPHFIALAVLAIGLPWFFLLSDEDHRLLPSLFIVGGAVAVLALDYFGPAALPDPLAAQDPEPWKRPPAANAAEAQAYQAWVAQATTAAQVAPSALTTPAAPAFSQPQAANVAQPLTNEAVAQQVHTPASVTPSAVDPAPTAVAPSMPPAPEAPAPRQSAAEELNRPISIGPLTSSSKDAPVNQPFSVGPLASPAPALQQAPEPQQVSAPQQVSVPQQAPDIAQPQQASADAYDDDDLDMTRAAVSPGSRFTAADAIDPATPWEVQAEIARTRPDLWVALSKNPSIYPDLKAWLDRHINK